MRIEKTGLVAGIPAPIARDLAKLFLNESATGAAERVLSGTGITAEEAVAALAAHGFIQKTSSTDYGWDWWMNTASGNALRMASFGKPIRRATAERLLAGVIDRAREYNADPEKPNYVERLRVFGSYLDADAEDLGDIDLELVFGTRHPGSASEALDYAHDSGRSFSSFLDRLGWGEQELTLILRNRSAYINITKENIERITDRFEVVYDIHSDPGAIPPLPGSRMG